MKMLDDLKAKLSPKTPAEKETLKKTVVYTILILSCLLCFWIIFTPSGKDNAEQGNANMDLPDQTSAGIPETKIAAYEQDAMKKQMEQSDSTINAISLQLDTVAIPDTPSVPDEIQSSADAYRQAQASLQDFYIPDYSESSQVAELQARIDELEAQQSQPDYTQSGPDEMELLERSYQLAAQYMGNGNGNSGNYQAPPQKEEEKGKCNVQPVAQVNRSVVSSLGTSSERGFNTSVGGRKSTAKNTISAVVSGDQTITNGQSVRLRLTEPMWVGSTLIPKNTMVTGESRLQGERLEIVITSVESQGSVYEVELQVYDSDGQEGINIPNSMEMEALQEIGANMGSTVGSSVNISTNAGAQIVSDVGKGLLNGVSQYLTKKTREVKVKLKAGYRVMLHQSENI